MTILSKSEEDTAFVFERFTIPANDWVGILADQNGRNFIRAIKHGRVAFQRQEITLEKILREYFGCQKPVLKRPVWDEDGNLRFLTIRGVKAYSALVSMLYALDTFFGPCTIAELQKEINSGKPELFGMNMASEKIDEIFNAVLQLVFGEAEAIAAKPFSPDDIIETLDDIVAGRTDGMTSVA